MKLFNQTLAAAAILLAAAALFSCQKGPRPEDERAREEKEKAEKADVFWDIVGQLVAASDITPDYKGKTFEPVIGVEDALNPQARIVHTNSAAAAARSFADLIGLESMDENTPSYTWRNSEVGTLTYTRMDGSLSWAEVKVDIPSVPHLSRIIYRSAQQGDINASFKGSAYYRFGDVIKRDRQNGSTEYWVCVRPAFSPEGKGETHWMSIGNLPDENIWHYTSSHNKDYYLPTRLKSSKEHMQNLAEMLFALCFPEEWADNIFKYSKVGWTGPYGLPIFHDFSLNNATYHNASFWKNVATSWREKGIDWKLFNKSLDQLSREIDGPDLSDGAGIHFLYKGYSWVTTWSNSATLYEARFEKGAEQTANMHTKNPCSEKTEQLVYDDPNWDIVFDVRGKASLSSGMFFGNGSDRYIVRYATGAELSSTGKYSDVHEAIPGTTDEYRYYRDVLRVDDLASHTPEITEAVIVNNPDQFNRGNYYGDAHYKLGDIYEDEKGHHWLVVNMAGTHGLKAGECESVPYSELVSFEGVTNLYAFTSIYALPVYQLAERVTTQLHSLFASAVPSVYDTDMTDAELPVTARLIRFFAANAKVDVSRFFQMVKPSIGSSQNYTHMTSFAYHQETANEGQHVARFLLPYELDSTTPPYYFWKHYPTNPSATARTYDSYSSKYIFLQDVANAEKVGIYAKDLYATRGFHPAQATNGRTEGERPYRTQTEPAASRPENYVYNYAEWERYSNPTDMWNEPVLMFRTETVYDRGNEYSTITLSGRRLSLVKEFPLTPGVVADAARQAEENKKSLDALYSVKKNFWTARNSGAVYLDGQPYLIADWQTAWDKEMEEKNN